MSKKGSVYDIEICAGHWVGTENTLHSRYEDAHRVQHIDTEGFAHFSCGAGDYVAHLHVVSEKFKNRCRKCRLAPMKVYMDVRKVAGVMENLQ